MTTVLVAGSVSLAQAQTPPAKPAAAADSEPALGSIEIGARPTSTTGDEARYERFRDLQNGAFSRIRFSKESSSYYVDLKAQNIGYHDQNYGATYNSRRVNVSFEWDSIPLNYSYLTSTPYTETSPGVFSLSSSARQQVQSRLAVGIPCAPGAPPAACGNPTQAAQALANRSIYVALANPFDLTAQRDTANVALRYSATRDLSLNLAVTSTRRDGHQPWGASFSFNNAVEVPLPLDNRTNDVSLGLEYASTKGMVRVGWDGSWFTNNIDSLTWDNPIRATDFSNGLAPPLGPFDPSGYSNGNGPAQGRMATAPDSSLNVISATGLYKMPSHTTVNGTLSVLSSKQDDTLIPWTINSLITPLMPGLPRATAQAEVRGYNGLFNFNSRPNKFLGITARYRFNSHDNRTPLFDAREYVRFDAVPEETGGESEQFDVTRDTLDVTGAFTLLPHATLRVGYLLDAVARTGRSFANMKDRGLKSSLDVVGNGHVTLRATYEWIVRTGEGFSESVLEDGGVQPGLRFYDESDRDRNRGTALVILSPTASFDIQASVAAGKDRYKGEGHDLGLLNADTLSVNVGATYSPSMKATAGVNYGRDTFSSLQVSRNANPPGTDYGSWFDPNRKWSLDHDETVNNFDAWVELNRLIQKTDISLSYNYADSDQAFVHGGPRVQELTANAALSGPSAILYPGFTIPAPCAAGLTTCFERLPNVTNTWQRLQADVRVFFTKNVGVGLAYWFEKFEVTDYATIDTNGSAALTGATGQPRIDYLSTLLLGYGNRPYKGNTGFLRLIYRF
ncbi:MAG: MtrB/PioB family outer membrane beta-barrel protein [Vicinamibacterales bacterium]